MFKKVVSTAALFVCVALIMPHTSSAQTVSDALSRMDAIIVEMEKLRAEFAALSARLGSSATTAPAPVVQGASAASSLTMDLSYGETNEDIARIQRLLSTDPEIYDHPHVTGFFGPKTEEAIRNFQTRFGLQPVGIIGPATTALLEVFFAAYPGENYPDGVLDNKPAPVVAGANTSVTPATPTQTTTPTPAVGAAQSIDVEFDRGEAEVDIRFTNGNRRSLFVSGDDEDDIIDAIAARTPLSVADIKTVIRFDGLDDDDDDEDDYDEDDAEDALDDAEDALDDAEDEIDEAEEDGEDTDWAEDTLDEAEELFEEAEDAFDDEDWEEAVELALEAEDMAKEAEDRIGEEEGGKKGDSDEIDSIEVDVDEDESEVTVEYEDDDDYEFEVEEDKRDEIIEEIADELDIDEDDVEDLIEFDYGDIDEIDVLIDEDEGEAEVEVELERGWTLRMVIDEDDEDDIIEELAEYFNEDEDDIEDVIDFEYK